MSYDYIKIITDRDWSLVGIIPNSNSNHSKNPFNFNPQHNHEIKATIINKKRSNNSFIFAISNNSN